MAAGSLGLGSISLVMAFIIPGATVKWIGAVLALIGIILGVQGRKIPEKHGLATGGMVCSIIGFIACIIVVIACAGLWGGIMSISSSYR